ncbi:TPA: hypothetical protein ACGOVC_001000 [Streptococcus suis]
MDKERVINLLDQLSPILAGKEETIGKELTEQARADDQRGFQLFH